MKSYIPATSQEQQAMLEAMGVSSIEDLLRDIPAAVRLNRPLNLGEGLSETEVLRRIQAYAKDTVQDKPLFRGAGAYRHFIPSIINAILQRGELLTAYTPYQPEMSQGMLQMIFEYQSLIARLTGMEASNASVYDGSTAAAEAMLICRDTTRRHKLLVSEGVHPDVRKVLATYAFGEGMELVTLPLKDGKTDPADVAAHADAAGLLIACPNYYGIIEDTAALAAAIHSVKGLLVDYVNPITLGLLKKPGALGVDVAIGDAQPLGNPLSFGGPYAGFMAVPKKLMRSLPGRIVGETVDDEGTRTYVLTLQAREQHIRREKAASNICSNESLCALAAAMYLTAMGPQGLKEVAESCLQKSHALCQRLCAVKGLRLAYAAPFFHEFVIESDCSAQALEEAASKAGITGGLPLDEHHTLFCATEMNTASEIDALVGALEGIA